MAKPNPRRPQQQGTTPEPAESVQEAPETVTPDEETTQEVPTPQEQPETVSEPADDEEVTELPEDSELARRLALAKERGYERVEHDGKLYTLDGDEWVESDIESEPVQVDEADQPTDEAKIHVTPELAESLGGTEQARPFESEKARVSRERQEAYDAEWPKKVRTKMEPNNEIEVGPKEYSELKFQGLLKSE